MDTFTQLPTEDQEQVIKLTQYLLTQGEQSGCPEWYEDLKRDREIADFFRCSVLDARLIHAGERSRALISIEAERAVKTQREREQLRREPQK